MKKSSKKILFITGLVLLSLIIISVLTIILQSPPKYPFAKTTLDKYFDEYSPNYSVSKGGLIQDVDAMINYTNDLHADPYRMISKEEFLAKAEEIKSKINSDSREEIPAIDAFYYTQELAAFVQDGHTSLFPLNWEKTVESIFPLGVTSVENRIFVDKNYGENEIPERAEILAVNGISIEQMKDDINKYIPATLSEYKEAQFAERFVMWVQTYYKMQPPWNVTYRYNGIIKTATIEGISKDSEELPLTGAYEELDKDYTESNIEINGEKIPVIEFAGFGNEYFDVFKNYIDNFFAENKNEKYLIIDVRHNPGGDGGYGLYVLSYLTNSLKGYKEFSVKVNSAQKKIIQYFLEQTYYEMNIPKFLWKLPLYKLVPQDDPSYWNARGILEAKPDTNYYAKWENEKSYLANESVDKFKGKIFLLTSSETFSAGVGFAGLFKSNNLGIIVGRETGGRNYMESDQRPVMLPNSNLLYLVPVFKYVVNDDNPDSGVIPDFPVELTVQDYINNKDRDMEKVIELIKAN